MASETAEVSVLLLTMVVLRSVVETAVVVATPSDEDHTELASDWLIVRVLSSVDETSLVEEMA